MLVCLRAARTGGCAIRARRRALQRHHAGAARVRAAAVLSRDGVPLLVRRSAQPPALRGWAALALAAGLTLVPWFTYNYVYLGNSRSRPRAESAAASGRARGRAAGRAASRPS